ncbi:MAG TPA: fused MFS/spermidine synthase [Vicinamibacterales bacterium]|nr:fused MFS/spermidine synthase [Vicinamibacterales bacterium]
MLPLLFLAAYACSGFAGLVYEVSWTRLLTLEMGRGIAASSTVLAAFMGGLALGAALAGRWAATLTPRQALRAYAGLELLVAVLALALPRALRLVAPLFASAYQDGTAGVGFGLMRLGISLGLLLVPAMALGATFPVAVRWFASAGQRSSHLAGQLYASNTIGAAVGALLSGFVLVPALGISGTLFVGVGASLAAMGIALLLVSRVTAADPSAIIPAPVPVPVSVSASSPAARSPRLRKGRQPVLARADVEESARPLLAGALLAITGFATFVAEVVWTRVFSLLVGPSTYAFASTVAAFIGGLAVGATIGTAIGSRSRRPALAIGVLLGAATIGSAWAANAAGTTLPHQVVADFARSPDISIVSHAISLALTVLPMAIAIGAAFPLGLQLAGGAGAPPRTIGAVYAVNTVGAVAGSLAAGFALVPLLGLERSLTAVSVLLACAALLALGSGAATLRTRAAGAVPVAIGLLVLLTAGPWDRDLLASGAYKYASSVAPGLDVETALKSGTLVYYRDGATSTVSVKRLTGALSLAIDGKVDASTAGDMLTQKLLAHLPMLLHGAPKEICIIGLGSGITLASALTHPVTTVDVLEISPEVVEASRLFTPNGTAPIDDARTRLVVADGRTHLALSTRKYDVIVSEPSNPWMAGVAALFTREFFESARRRLAEHGVICQWVNTYDISTRDLQSVVATFTSVFPHATLWLAGDGDLMLVGSQEPMDRKVDQLATTPWTGAAAIAADLQTVAVTSPFGLLSMFVGADAAAGAFGAGAALQTDDRMALEFSAPRALHTAARRDNVERLRSMAGPDGRPASVARVWAEVTGEQLAQRAVMLRRAGAFGQAYDAASDAIARFPDRSDALQVLVEAAAATGRQADAIGRLTDTVRQHADLVAPRVALSRLQAAQGAFDAAIKVASEAVQQHPDDAAALEQLASIYADAGDADRLAPLVPVLAQFPDRPGSRYYTAAHHFMRGELSQAQQAAQQALSIDPRFARAQNLLGAIFATQGDTASARRAFQTSLALDSQDPTTYQNLALLELNTGNAAAAAQLFGEALTLDPSSEPARQGLARARGAI